ncbi:hypothetical protein MHPYR_460042 [uncultured Mycobacterium sp.]|uniref:Uncharacterized protein n=1 Tax=uncultured Mycobacterium sp. TaxID=171292 RepID=A0A1Y5PG16_9MYCO|nr:hypothetical protein MHPYR_460042 [uncultured Mycobacterium sp.]
MSSQSRMAVIENYYWTWHNLAAYMVNTTPKPVCGNDIAYMFRAGRKRLLRVTEGGTHGSATQPRYGGGIDCAFHPVRNWGCGTRPLAKSTRSQ